MPYGIWVLNEFRNLVYIGPTSLFTVTTTRAQPTTVYQSVRPKVLNC